MNASCSQLLPCTRTTLPEKCWISKKGNALSLRLRQINVAFPSGIPPPEPSSSQLLPVWAIAVPSQQCHSSLLPVTPSGEQTPSQPQTWHSQPTQTLPASHWCAAQGTLLTHPIFPVSVSTLAAPADISSHCECDIPVTLTHSRLRWLTGSTFSAALSRRNSPSSPKPCCDTMAESGISLECVPQEPPLSSAVPAPGTHFCSVEEFLFCVKSHTNTGLALFNRLFDITHIFLCFQ